jgi:hypothetical protein
LPNMLRLTPLSMRTFIKTFLEVKKHEPRTSGSRARFFLTYAA